MQEFLGEAMIRENMALMAKIRESMAIIYQKQGEKDQAVLEFHKCLALEIKVRGDNHPLPLLFESMLQRRAEKTKNFEIPTHNKWLDILQALKEESVGKKMGKVPRSSVDKQIRTRGLVIKPREGQAEALKGTLGWYVHQGEVFGVLRAALEEENDMKQLRKNAKDNNCNITDVVVDDFLRALDVCYNLAGTTVVTPPAGIKRFESGCPPPDHKAYMHSEYLQKVLPKLERTGAAADLNETAAKRFKDFLARIKTAAEVAATATAAAEVAATPEDQDCGGSGSNSKCGKKREISLVDGDNERVNHMNERVNGIQVDLTRVQFAMRKHRVSGAVIKSVVASLLGAAACTTVVILGTMDEGQLKDQPVQRRLLGIGVAGQYLELDGSVNEKQVAFAGLLVCLVAAVVLFLELRKRWQLNCKDPWKNLGTGRNCKDREADLQTLAQEDLAMLVEGIWFHLERPEVVAGALTAVLKIMAGPRAAEVFQVPKVADEQADENARKAFRVGVVEVTLALMEKHRRVRDVLAPACGVLWAINASPEADEIRVHTAACGGIPLLFGALECFGTDTVIVEAVLNAMGNIMYDNDDNKAATMAARALLNNGKEASGVERVIELLNAGADAGHAGIQESAVKVLRKLANFRPPSRRFSSLRKKWLKSAPKERLNELGVEKILRDAMDRPQATANLKEDGQKLLDRLRKRNKVPQADANETARD